MARVFVVGIGPGSTEYILPKAVDILSKSDVVLGFSRALESLNFIDVLKIKVCKLNEILDIINCGKYHIISVAASGDPTFYGITDYLKKNYERDMEIVPGISSFQYMISKIQLSWQDSYLGSAHGRNVNILPVVRCNRISIWLTDICNSPDFMAKILYENGINALLYVGENLSYGNEKIITGSPFEIKHKKFQPLSVVVIKNLDIC